MTTAPKHILVVEDDEMVQAFLALHLEIEGYTVTLAGNGREMLRAISGGHPDLILLDPTAMASASPSMSGGSLPFPSS